MPPTDQPRPHYEQYLVLYTNGDKPGQLWLTVAGLNERDNTRSSSPSGGLTRSCPIGYTVSDVEALGERFGSWIRGQTVAVCEGRRYNYNTREYEPDACAEHPHGVVFYPWDVDRYLRGLPVID